MNWRTSCVFCLFSILILVTTSCSSLIFLASGNTPLKIAANSKSERSVEITGKSDFYFWGLSPGHVDIDLGDHANRLGLNLPSFVRVEQSVGPLSFFYTLVTLGLYCPVDYKIVVLTKAEDLH